MYREYKRAETDIDDALMIIDEAEDDEMREMAQEELKEAKSRLERLTEELTILLLPRDPNDDKNIIVDHFTYNGSCSGITDTDKIGKFRTSGRNIFCQISDNNFSIYISFYRLFLSLVFYRLLLQK